MILKNILNILVQNINKVSTAIILQYELFYKDYPKWFIQNLENNFANKISKKNILTIKKNKHRSQLTNKKEALNKLKQIFKISAKRKDFRLKTLVPFKSKMKRSSLKIKNSKKIKYANYVIVNNKSLNHLKSQLSRIEDL